MRTLPLLKSLTVAAGLFGAAPLFGQAVKIEVEKPSFEDLQSPELGGNTGKKKWDPKDWLEVEVEMKVEARPEPKDKYLDSLSVRWYVAVENPAAKGYYLLEKDVEYVNVPVGESFFVSVYLSPASIQRLTGGDRAGKNSVTAVGGEVKCMGETAEFSEGQKPGWWNSGSLSRTEKFPLLSKSETPFKFLWWDRFLEERQGRR